MNMEVEVSDELAGSGVSHGVSKSVSSYREGLKGKRPKKGIPSDDAFYLPRKDSLDKLLGKQSAVKTSTSWALEDVLQFVFPVEYRGSMHSAALQFLRLLRDSGGSLASQQIGEFVQRSGVSKATFYNKVVPRLVRVGMVERNREPGSKKMTVSWSNQFASYLEKIAFEWKRLEPEKG